MMITEVLAEKGEKKSKKDTFDRLVELNPNDPYKRQKAAASIGGSKNSGYLVEDDDSYTCTRDKV
jgi:hypothetical protein